MIAGILHQGSGLGNQLFRFVGTKIIAERKGQGHGMVGVELFKGASFMKLPLNSSGINYQVIPDTGKVVMDYLRDTTVIDAEFQSEADFIDEIEKIREWIKVEPMSLSDDLCVISHRGGEYAMFPDLYLTNEYWDRAIVMMRQINPEMKFEVQTDDSVAAQKQFPDFPIVQDMQHNWRSIRYAKYLIVGNSSFSILPSLMNENVRKIIAPKFHAGHNKGYWQEPNNCYRKYTYV